MAILKVIEEKPIKPSIVITLELTVQEAAVLAECTGSIVHDGPFRNITRDIYTKLVSIPRVDMLHDKLSVVIDKTPDAVRAYSKLGAVVVPTED
jgi:hypothetical protein